MKPEQRIIVLQHQSHLLQASGEEVRSLGSTGPFDYEGSDVTWKGYLPASLISQRMYSSDTLSISSLS